MTDTKNLLIVTNVTPVENGIKYSIKPYNKSILISPNKILQEKDHSSSAILFIPKLQNFVVIPTAINHPNLYKIAIKNNNTNLTKLLLNINDEIGTIIHELW